MKTNILFILLCCTLLGACLEDKRSQRAEATEAISSQEIKKDAPVEQNAELASDSTRKDVTDSTAMKSGPEVPEYKAETSKHNDEGTSMWVLIALAIGAVNIVSLAIIKLSSDKRYRGIYQDFEEYEDKTDKKIASLNRKVADIQKDIANDMQKQQKQLSELSRHVDGMNMKTMGNTENDRRKPIGMFKKENEDKTTKSKQKFGYFGVVKAGNGLAMFNDYPTSRNDDAYFEMTYLDDTHCEFAPFDLERIRSIDDINSAVNYLGSMAYAKAMKVVKKGKAEFDCERNFWRITDRVEIELI